MVVWRTGSGDWIGSLKVLIGFMILVLQVIPITAKDHTVNTKEFGLPCLWRKIKVPKSLLADKGFAGDMRIGDLDGDGEVDFILFRSTDGRMKPCFIGAFDSNGRELWRHGAGGNQPQRPGPLTVYDFDGDGRAEILCLFINPAVKASVNSMNNVVVQIRDGSTGKVIRRATPASIRQCAG
ncbi:MAG: rhamnogalacturonan lyase family protein, partial [Planctomycetota bacterium]